MNREKKRSKKVWKTTQLQDALQLNKANKRFQRELHDEWPNYVIQKSNDIEKWPIKPFCTINSVRINRERIAFTDLIY